MNKYIFYIKFGKLGSQPERKGPNLQRAECGSISLVISVCKRLRKDSKFSASMGYTVN